MKIDAIILSNTSDLHHYGLTCRTINSLKRSDIAGEINIIVVESQGSLSFQTAGFIYDGCLVIHPEEKFGYNKFLNIGISLCDSEWVLICNNDLFFTKNWLKEAEAIVGRYPEIKSFSPRCPHWHLHQNIDEYIVEGYRVSSEVCGWCILLKRELVKDCKLFDEQFEFWYQDNDYALTLKMNNEKHALMRDSKVYHLVSGSHDLLKDRYDELTVQQQERFINKWGHD